MQGYLFSRPVFQSLGTIADDAWPASETTELDESVEV